MRGEKFHLAIVVSRNQGRIYAELSRPFCVPTSNTTKFLQQYLIRKSIGNVPRNGRPCVTSSATGSWYWYWYWEHFGPLAATLDWRLPTPLVKFHPLWSHYPLAKLSAAAYRQQDNDTGQSGSYWFQRKIRKRQCLERRSFILDTKGMKWLSVVRQTQGFASENLLSRARSLKQGRGERGSTIYRLTSTEMFMHDA